MERVEQIVPIITFTTERLKPGTKGWISTCKSVRKAMEDFSCFVGVYDDETPLMISGSDVFSPLKEFFYLPREIKSLNKSEIPGFGYIQNPGSFLESMGIGDSTAMEAVQSFSNLMWPLGNHHFCEQIHGYTTEVSKIQESVMRMMFEEYGVDRKKCESHLNSTCFLLRANFYTAPLPEDETRVGIKPHTDTSVITIVKQDEVGGLQVQYGDNSGTCTWIPVHFPPSSFIVLAGDALYAWSRGKIRACFHRVILDEKARMSVGVFSFHKGIVQVPEELAGEDDSSLQFNSFDHMGLLRFRVKNPALSSEERVKAFCTTPNDL